MSTPPGWNLTTLGALGEYVNGRAFKPSDWGTAGLPIIRIQNLTDPAKPFNRYAGPVGDRHRVENGDLLISWSATLGSFIWDRGPAVLNQHIFKVEERPSVVTREFLHFLVLHSLSGMAEHVHGSTMTHITKGRFDAFPVAVPPLPEQRRIVGRIKECTARIDELRELRTRALEEAEGLAGALFAEFAATQSGAPVRPLGDLVRRVQYGTSTRANDQAKGTPVLRMGNIRDWVLDPSDIKHVELGQSDVAKYRLKGGDILVNRTNSLELVGKAAVFEGLEGDWVFASYLVRLDPLRDLVVPGYLNAVINSRIGRRYIAHRARRAIGMVNINAEEIKALPVPLPPRQQQEVAMQRLAEVRQAARDMLTEMRAESAESLAAKVLEAAFAGKL